MGKEIKIAGAGLSGLVAGINLLKAGHVATIYEQNGAVGARFCSDFQGMANWMSNTDVLEFLRSMNIETDFFASPARQGIFFGPKLKMRADFAADGTLFYLVKRGGDRDCVDFCLKQQFIKAGGNIIFNKRADPGEVDIIATGPKRARFATLGYNFETGMSDTAVEVIDNDIAPKAYAYLLVRGGLGTMGTVLMDDFRNHEKYLGKTLAAFEKELGLAMENEKKFGGFANSFLTNSAVKDGKLYVGEAAGFLDNLTGFGMFFACRSGYLAAKSIIEGSDYDALWKNDFGGQIKASLVNRFLFEVFGNTGYNAITWLVAKNQGRLLELLKNEYRYDWKMKMIYPAAYFLMKKKFTERS